MKGLYIFLFVLLLFFTFFILKPNKPKSQIVVASQQQNNFQHNNNNNNQASIKFIFKEPLWKVSSKYPNYFNEVIQNNNLYRWNKINLYYYIEAKTGSRLNTAKIKRAFSHWERKSGVFRFYQTQNPKLADIRIRLMTLSNKSRVGEGGPDDLIVGRTFEFNNKTYNENIIKTASISASSESFSFENVQKYEKAGIDAGFTMLVHEIGHVLGIMAHSSNQGDCMYYQMDAFAKSCNNLRADANTLAMLYGKSSSLNKGFYDIKEKVYY